MLTFNYGQTLILCLFVLLQGILCFAYEKQNDEISCGVVSAYNLINDKCPNCKDNEIPDFHPLPLYLELALFN